MSQLIKPKEIEINGKQFIISKFPASEGRDIVIQYIASGMPKLGDYAVNKEMAAKLMGYVAVVLENGNHQCLTTKALINNHVEDWEMHLALEKAMGEYNCSFFQNGSLSTLLNSYAQRLPAWITKIVTDSLHQLLQKVKPPSTN